MKRPLLRALSLSRVTHDAGSLAAPGARVRTCGVPYVQGAREPRRLVAIPGARAVAVGARPRRRRVAHLGQSRKRRRRLRRARREASRGRRIFQGRQARGARARGTRARARALSRVRREAAGRVRLPPEGSVARGTRRFAQPRSRFLFPRLFPGFFVILARVRRKRPSRPRRPRRPRRRARGARPRGPGRTRARRARVVQGRLPRRIVLRRKTRRRRTQRRTRRTPRRIRCLRRGIRERLVSRVSRSR